MRDQVVDVCKTQSESLAKGNTVGSRSLHVRLRTFQTKYSAPHHSTAVVDANVMKARLFKLLRWRPTRFLIVDRAIGVEAVIPP